MKRCFIVATRIQWELTMNFEESPAFRRDWKKLVKKYTSLSEDMEFFSDIVSRYPLSEESSKSVILRRSDCFAIVKARLTCRTLRKSSLRVIYAYCETRNKIEFIEIYFKGDKTREDRKRVETYVRQCSRLSRTG